MELNIIFASGFNFVTIKERDKMTVPDTMEGALILSVIDFSLSIVIIWGLSFILYIFPHLNKLGSIDENKLKGGH